MSLSRIVDSVSTWMDLVAEAIVAASTRLGSARSVQLIEGDGGSFSLHSPDTSTLPLHPPFCLDGEPVSSGLPDAIAAHLQGREVELVLQSKNFLFRPLALPGRAAEFLDGIVRAQIDRLTPWSANEVVFGWTQPVQAADDRINLTVAATIRERINLPLQTLKALGAKSIIVSTVVEDSTSEPERIQVYQQAITGALGVARVRSILLAVLATVAAAATLSTAASQIMGADLNAQLNELNNRIAAQRSALSARAGGGENSAVHALERRKHDNAATVLVLEALSQALPDHTYVTEVHIEGDKLQVIGMSGDAPALIQLMEQSSHFLQATFAAPTTNVPDGTGERFHIEAKIKTPFEVGP